MQNNLSTNLTTFETRDVRSGSARPASHPVSRAQNNPYEHVSCPRDIYDFLLSDGSKFGLFSDPYATMQYYQPSQGQRNGPYWINSLLEGEPTSSKDIRLIELLSNHFIMTRKQIERALFPELSPGSRYGIEFLKKCRSKGIICAINWDTPLKDERAKPLSYALNQFSAKAYEMLFNKKLQQDAWFRPVELPQGKGPDMTLYFVDLIANELYSEIVRIDRLMDWKRKPVIRSGNNFHIPAATFEVIKDENTFYTFWLEVFRPVAEYTKKTSERFMRIHQIYHALPENQRPIRLIVIADGDARIKELDWLARRFMPDVPIRFSTDERILDGIGEDTFVEYNHDKDSLIKSCISFLMENAEGMTRSQYLKWMEVEVDDNFEE